MDNFDPNNRFKNMTAEQKLKIAERLYWSARNLKKSSLRSFHPEWTEEEIEKAAKEAFMYARS
jgi:hypothetical protein